MKDHQKNTLVHYLFFLFHQAGDIVYGTLEIVGI